MWTSGAPLISARYGHGVAVLQGVVFAVAGKGINGTVLRTCEKFDPAVGYWSPDVPPLPPLSPAAPGRFLVVAVAVQDLAIWAIGGSDDAGTTTNTVDILVGPHSPLWVQGQSLPESRVYHAAGVLFDAVQNGPVVVVVGGNVGGGLEAWSNRTTAFNTVLVKWERKADMLAPRQFPAAGVVANTLYVAGGFNGVDGVLASVEAYDRVHDKWSFVSRLSSGVVAPSAGVVVSVDRTLLLLTAGGLAAFNPNGNPVASASSRKGAARRPPSTGRPPSAKARSTINRPG